MTTDAPKLIELINVKNQYKDANIVRNLLTATLIVAGIALGIFGSTFGLVFAGVHIAVAGFTIHLINQNNKIVNELQTTGFRHGMRVK